MHDASPSVQALDHSSEMTNSPIADIPSEENDDVLKRLALDAIPFQVAILNRHGTIIAVNAAWRRFASENSREPGVPDPRTGVGTDYLEICAVASGMSSEGGMRAGEGIRAVLEGRQNAFSMEYPCHAPSRQRWFLMTVTPLGGPGGAMVIHTDVSEHKLNELRLQMAMEATGDGVWDWNLATGEAYLSPSYYALTGYHPDEVKADIEFFKKLVHPHDLPDVMVTMERHLRGEIPGSDVEYRMITASGEVRWIRGRGRVMERNEAGVPQRMVGLIMDVTEGKRIEQALKESEEHYRAVVEDQTELISRIRADGSFLFVNEVYCRFFGKTPEELIGHSWMPVCHPDDLPKVLEGLAGLTPENPVVVIENRVYSGDGELHWMQFANRGFFDPEGRLREIQSVGRDINELKQTESALREVLDQMEQRVLARTEEVRRLAVEATLVEERERQAIARDLHDDLGQRLHVMRLKLDTLARSRPEISDAIEEIRMLLGEASQEVRSLTSQLGTPVLKKLGLAPALAWLVEEMARLYGLDAEFSHGDVRGRLDAVQSAILFRAARELLINVIKHAGTPTARMHLEESGGILRLTVEDDGRGLPGGEAGNGRGAGFGLASIRERLAFLGGKADFEATPGGGLRVILSLPLVLDEGVSH